MRSIPKSEITNGPIDLVECCNCGTKEAKFTVCLHCEYFFCTDCYMEHLANA